MWLQWKVRLYLFFFAEKGPYNMTMGSVVPLIVTDTSVNRSPDHIMGMYAANCDVEQWRHNEHGGVSNRRRLHCLLNCLFRHRSKKISKLRSTGLCKGNWPVTGEFPAQRSGNAKNASIWWRHHGVIISKYWCIHRRLQKYRNTQLSTEMVTKRSCCERCE